MPAPNKFSGTLPIDSHCHLTDFKDIHAVLMESKGKLNAIFTCGYSKESSLGGIDLALSNPGFVFAIAGESPQRVMEKPAVDIGWLHEAKGIVAIGEIGLDKHWGKSEAQLTAQKEWFLAQVALAEERKLPIVIHSRDAESECIEILAKSAHSSTLMHCFSGTPEQARQAMDLGCFFTIPPGNYKSRRKVIKAVELDYLMLESDAPYLGKAPISVLESAKMISEEKGLSLEEVIASTTRNSLKFYGVG
jgi:TatD DNase family protein